MLHCANTLGIRAYAWTTHNIRFEAKSVFSLLSLGGIDSISSINGVDSADSIHFAVLLYNFKYTQMSA